MAEYGPLRRVHIGPSLAEFVHLQIFIDNSRCSQYTQIIMVFFAAQPQYNHFNANPFL
jgi:hypothetical protein